ncbi:MAG: hypothetical protein QXN26_07200, partial [Thermoplasmataceae archaeon]
MQKVIDKQEYYESLGIDIATAGILAFVDGRIHYSLQNAVGKIANTQSKQAHPTLTFFENDFFVVPIIEIGIGSVLMTFAPNVGSTIFVTSFALLAYYAYEEYDDIKQLVSNVETKVESNIFLKNIYNNLVVNSTLKINYGQFIIPGILTVLGLLIMNANKAVGIIMLLVGLIWLAKIAYDLLKQLPELAQVAKVLNVNV